MDFTYFEKHYKLTAADLSKQKDLYADLRAIQQIIFTSKIKSTLANTRVIIYYILEESKETILQFSKGITTLTDRQLKQLKTTVKDKTGTTPRMSLKMFDGNDLPHELLLTTRQKT